MNSFCIEVAPTPCILAIFGATGDLATRKLFPSLLQLHRRGLLHSDTRIVGCGRGESTDGQLRGHLRATLPQKNAALLDHFLARLSYCRVDPHAPATFAQLNTHISSLERSLNAPTPLNHLFYLAVPPSAYQPTIGELARCGALEERPESGWKHMVLEKPFGVDSASADELNAFLLSHARESQIYRIDHYLAKETVQNILILRFGNAVFEPLWNTANVDHVQITVAESLGVEGRAAYFDQSGLLRDMFQNHIMELVALTAMEPPETFTANAIHARKLDLIRAIRPFTNSDLQEHIVRGQYTCGDNLPGYLEEEGIAPGSTTETYIAAKLWVDTPRWQGVPFYLRSGKRMGENSSAISIVFKQSPFLDMGLSGTNILELRMKPREGMRLHLLAKAPGPKLCFDNLPLSFDYASLSREQDTPDDYARLLLDAMLDDQTLFVRSEAIAASWEQLTPVLEFWREQPDLTPLHGYPAGAAGPAAANRLLARDRRAWLPL